MPYAKILGLTFFKSKLVIRQIASYAKDGEFRVKIWFSDQQFKEITQTRYYSN